MTDVWVFGYGSLMWDYSKYQSKKVIPAVLHGWKRIYNKLSTVSRGTPDHPGIVLGIREVTGASCIGRALLIDKRMLEAIRDREQGKSRREYLELSDLQVTDIEGNSLPNCYVYIPNPERASFISEVLSFDEKAAIALNSRPPEGNPWDYIVKTHQKALELGIDDPTLRGAAEAVIAMKQELADTTRITDVEVYQKPEEIRVTGHAIGLPETLRKILNVNEGGTVKVTANQRAITATVFKTSKGLISGGDSPADNPNKHCWLNESARTQLNLIELPLSQRRASLRRFRKQYTPVTIEKIIAS
ncbi:MAG: gamma-glutamylcyclotransferase [Nanoarchaeota archaeon]